MASSIMITDKDGVLRVNGQEIPNAVGYQVQREVNRPAFVTIDILADEVSVETDKAHVTWKSKAPCSADWGAKAPK